ncbi:unnamed protein product, partial [Ixodes hexagonus]
PIRRLVWPQFIMHTVSFNVHMGGCPALPLQPALHWFLSHFCGALYYSLGDSRVGVIGSLLVYKFGRSVCVCTAALSLPSQRLHSFFVFLDVCIPSVACLQSATRCLCSPLCLPAKGAADAPAVLDGTCGYLRHCGPNVE